MSPLCFLTGGSCRMECNARVDDKCVLLETLVSVKAAADMYTKKVRTPRPYQAPEPPEVRG